jgi:hypothetical protein
MLLNFKKNILIYITISLICLWVLPVEIISLDHLPLDTYHIIKKIPVQTVHKTDNFYVKIWNPCALQFKHDRNNDFCKAVFDGVFKDIAPLYYIILNTKGQCCGYATKICRPIHVEVADIRKEPLCKLQDNESQLVLQLFRLMRKRTLETGFCFTDLASSNLGILENQCFFIDLDGFWELSLYKKTQPDWKSALFYLDEKYKI